MTDPRGGFLFCAAICRRHRFLALNSLFYVSHQRPTTGFPDNVWPWSWTRSHLSRGRRSPKPSERTASNYFVAHPPLSVALDSAAAAAKARPRRPQIDPCCLFTFVLLLLFLLYRSIVNTNHTSSRCQSAWVPAVCLYL